jgi:ABC-type transport system involved in cytochrome bd biosynthesis fused ATPase/permease subunit
MLNYFQEVRENFTVCKIDATDDELLDVLKEQVVRPYYYDAQRRTIRLSAKVGLKVSGGENKDYHSRYFKIQIY